MKKSLPGILRATFLLLAMFIVAPSFGAKFFEDNDAFFLKYLKQEKFAIDTSAPAIVIYQYDLYDDATSIYKKHTVHKIIKILNKNGLDYASISIALPGYLSGHYYINKVKGCTYNLENGKLVKSILKDENTSSDRNKALSEKKFEMPAVHEGSIIDYSYEIEEEENYIIARWKVQSNIPKLYTEMEAYLPHIYSVSQTGQNMPLYTTMDDRKKNVDLTTIPDATKCMEDNGNLNVYRWSRRNVSAIHEELFITSINNYIETLVLYVSGVGNSGLYKFPFKDWDGISKMMLEQPGYMKPLASLELAINKKANEIAGDEKDDLVTTKKIYRYVRDAFKATDNDQLFIKKLLAKVMSDKSGTPTEINFVMMTMLRHLNIPCSPVIISIEENGRPNNFMPDLEMYDRAICEVRLNGQKYYLDASEKNVPFGTLPHECYNGYARVIDRNEPGFIIFSDDMVKNKTVFIVSTVSNAVTDYAINYKVKYGIPDAIHFRDKWNNDSLEAKKYVLELFKHANADVTLKSFTVQNLKDPDEQLALDFTISMKWPDNPAMIYLNPYFFPFYEDNPFKTPTRKLPVELPGKESQIYSCRLQLPQGYAIEEIPKSAIVKYDDSMQCKNLLEYDKESNTLAIDSRLYIPFTFFRANEYDRLKDFVENVMLQQKNVVSLKRQ